MTNAQRFETELATQYASLFETTEYAYVAARMTPQALAAKMTASLAAGTANTDGAGIKRTCKALGVRYTKRDIRAYLSIEGDAPVYNGYVMCPRCEAGFRGDIVPAHSFRGVPCL